MQEMEEKIAHLTRLTEDLSDIVARQDAELSKLSAQVDRLVLREAARDQAVSYTHLTLPTKA